nr:hypothetical protein BaRGS_024550 [Batillaria attramentaria]
MSFPVFAESRFHLPRPGKLGDLSFKRDFGTAEGFWEFLYSDRWEETCLLRVLEGELLDNLLAALYLLQRDHDVISYVTIAYFDNGSLTEPSVKLVGGGGVRACARKRASKAREREREGLFSDTNENKEQEEKEKEEKKEENKGRKKEKKKKQAKTKKKKKKTHEESDSEAEETPNTKKKVTMPESPSTREKVEKTPPPEKKSVTFENKDQLLKKAGLLMKKKEEEWHLSVNFAYLAGGACDSVGVRDALLRRREMLLQLLDMSLDVKPKDKKRDSRQGSQSDERKGKEESRPKECPPESPKRQGEKLEEIPQKPTPTPPMVLGKLRDFRFLKYRDHVPGRCSQSPPPSVMTVEELRDRLVQAMEVGAAFHASCHKYPGVNQARENYGTCEGFWDFLYSDRWEETCLLRVLEGELLDNLLAAFYLLQKNHDVISYVTIAYIENNYRSGAPVEPDEID